MSDSGDVLSSIEISQDSVTGAPRYHKNLNLSKISERTEYNETLYKSDMEKSTSISFVPNDTKTASNKANVLDALFTEKDKPEKSYFGRKELSKKRSVFGMLFGCFIPIYRFA